MKAKKTSQAVVTPSAEQDLIAQFGSRLSRMRAALDDCDLFFRSLQESQRTSVADDQPTWIYPEKVRMPAKMYLTKVMYETAKQHGYDVAQADQLFKGSLDGSAIGFCAYHRKPHAPRWANWQIAWRKYVERAAASRDGKSN